jgi:hypothetical protein
MTDCLNDSLVEVLANHRADFNGFNVAIAKMDQIDQDPDTSNTPVTLRSFIKAIYDSTCAEHMADGLLGYVLLLGDAAAPDSTVLIPGYYGYHSPKHKSSDAYYSFLSEDPLEDLFADIYIGRIPVDCSSHVEPPDEDWELRNVVEKVIAYRPDTLSTKRILMVSGFPGAKGELPHPIDYFDYIIDHYIPASLDNVPVVVDTMHRLQYPFSEGSHPFDECFSDSVAVRINRNAQWIVGLIGHGANYYLGQSFFPMHYDTLQNRAPLPVVLTSGCDLGWFDLEIDNWKNYCLLGNDDSNLHCYTPTDSLDTGDALAERLILQRKGAIGVLAFPREQLGVEARQYYAYMFRSVFEDNSFTLGDILLSTRLYCYPDSDSTVTRALTVFGDPALNIVWENFGETPLDSIDLVVQSTALEFPDAVGGRYISTSSSVGLNATVRNNWHQGASQVRVEVWDGDPDDQGTMLEVDTLATIPGFGDATAEIELGTLSEGDHDIYVLASADQYDEPSYVNNKAFKVLAVYDYEPGFPIKLTSHGIHSITIADVTDSYPGEEILFNVSSALKCYSAGGDSIWSRNSTQMGNRAGFLTGTPIVADIYKDGSQYTLYLDELLYILDAANGDVKASIDMGDFYTEWYQFNHQGQTFAVADVIPDDNTLEIVMNLRKETQPQYVSCYDVGSDSVAWKVPIGIAADKNAVCHVALGDIDGNGTQEIVVRTNAQTADSLYVFRSDGTNYWDNGERIGAASGSIGYVNEMMIADGGLDENGNALMNIFVTAYTGPHNYVYKFSSDGDSTVWEVGDQSPVNAIVASDVDLDGELEVVATYKNIVGTQHQGIIRILSSDDGSSENSAALDYPPTYTPLVVNLDADPEREFIIVLRSNNTDVYSDNKYVLEVRDDDLSIIKKYSFPFDSNEFERLYARGVDLVAMPAVADVDGDGNAEVAFVSPDSVIHLIEIGTMGYADWPQRYNNVIQSNNAGQPLAGEYDSTFSIYQKSIIIADTEFKGDVTVLPGTDLLVSTEDESESGSDHLRVEVGVFGSLEAKGTASKPVKIVSWDGDAEGMSKDDWRGIFVHDDSSSASATFEHCIIRNAQKAISTNVDITVKDCTIEACELLGVSIAGTDSVYIGNSTIRDTEVAGINLLENSVARISDCRIENMAAYGVDVYSGAKLYADKTVVRNCEWGIRVFIGDSLAAYGDVDSCSINSNNDMGMIVYGTSGVSMTNCVVDSNEVNAVYCDSSASISMEDNSVAYNAVGIYCNKGSDAAVRNNSIMHNGAGIICDDHSDPLVEENVMTSNGTGVMATNYSNPDLGHTAGSPYSAGLNSIHSNSGFYVANYTYGMTIRAENNYWAGGGGYTYCECEPQLRKIFGQVDFCSALCQSPQQASSFQIVGGDKQNLPAVYDLGQNYPNPFNPTTTIDYQVPAPGGPVSISIYNVRGQRVATIVDATKPPGYHKVTWDGRNARGISVASGVYFIQMKATGFVKTKKLLMLK